MTVNLISNYFFALFASLRRKGFYLDRTYNLIIPLMSEDSHE
jgi:hypothetical protein